MSQIAKLPHGKARVWESSVHLCDPQAATPPCVSNTGRSQDPILLECKLESSGLFLDMSSFSAALDVVLGGCRCS